MNKDNLTDSERIQVLEQQNDSLRKKNERLVRLLKARKLMMAHHEQLQDCPICGASPWLCEDIQDICVVCSEDCPAPRCEHTYPRDAAMSWNDWVRWCREVIMDGTVWFRKAHIKSQVDDT